MNNHSTASKSFKRYLSTDVDLPLWLYGTFIYIASLFLTGYYVFVANHCLQIPLIYTLNDPTIYPNDPFAATLPYYAAMLWRVVAWMNLIVPLKPLLFVSFLLERAFVLFAAAYLALAIAPKSKLAAVGAMIMFGLVPHPILGNGTIVQIYFEQTGMSIPFFLLAMAAFYKDRTYLWAVMLGLGFDMNSLYGAHAVVYFGMVMLVYKDYWREWKKWIAGIGLFLVVAFPAILYTFFAFLRKSLDSDLWVLANKVRSLHHLFPLYWDKTVFIKFFIVLAIAVLVLWQRRVEKEKLFKLGIVWAVTSVLWLAYAFVGTAVFASPSMIIMQPARATDFWYAFIGISFIALIATELENRLDRRRYLSILFVTAVFFWNPIILPVLMFILLLLFWEPVWAFILREASPKRLALVLTILFIFAAGYTARGRVKSGNGGWIFVNPDRQVTAIADWAKANTEKDDVFLLNPGTMWGNFRALSMRPVFVTWKDGSALLWDRSYTDIWVERLRALGYDITKGLHMRWDRDDKIDEIYNSINDNYVRGMKKSYKLDYRVVPKNIESNFPVVFETTRYKVLFLDKNGSVE